MFEIHQNVLPTCARCLKNTKLMFYQPVLDVVPRLDDAVVGDDVVGCVVETVVVVGVPTMRIK